MMPGQNRKDYIILASDTHNEDPEREKERVMVLSK